MNRTFSISLRLLAVGSLMACVAPAGGVSAAPLAIDEAVNLALVRSPQVKASGQELEVAQAKVGSSLAARLPRVDFEESYLRTDQPVASFGSLLNQGRFTAGLLDPTRDPALSALNHPDSLDNFRTRFAVRQPLFAGGQLYFQQEAQKQEVQAAREELTGTRADTGFAAIAAYWGLSLARESVAVAETAVRAAEDNLREIELLHKEGTVVRSDLLTAKVQLADFRDELVRARGNERVAARRLDILIGESPDGRWEVSRLCLPGNEQMPESSAESLLAVARKKRPDYTALSARWEASKNGVKAARGGLLPTLGLEASYEWNAPRFADDLEGSYLLGLGLNWNIFNGLGDSAKVREARGNQEMLWFAMKRLEDRISMEIEEVAVGLSTGRESLEVTRERVAMAEESLRIIGQRYREGLTTIVELEQAELSLSHSRLAWYKAVYDVRMAVARLRLVTGELLGSVSAPSCNPE